MDKDDLSQALSGGLKTPDEHFRAACIMASTLRLVRELPDFDTDPVTGEVPLFAQIIDAALRGEIHETLAMIGDIRDTYGSDEDGTRFF